MKQPWYDEQVNNEERLKCMKERKWKNSGNEFDYVALQYQKKHARKVIMQNKSNTTMTCSTTSVEIPKDCMQKPISHYAGKKPYHCQKRKTPKVVAEGFNIYFTSKIEKIMEGLVPTETHPTDESYIESTPMTTLSFTHFSVLSRDNVKRLVKKSATKSCPLDPIQTSLLK